MNHNYQLIAVDMDGTLLDSHQNVTPRTREAIHAAAGRGKEVVLCTGRGTAELFRYFELLPEVRYAICSSGAYVYDSRTDTFLFPHPLERSVLEALFGIMKPRDIMPQIFVGGTPYFSKRNMDAIERYQIDYFRQLFLDTGIFCEDAYAAALAAGGDIYKICFYHQSVEQRARSRELLGRLPLVLADSEISSLEVSPANVDKGTGLTSLCQHLHIPTAQTISVGDSFNDLSVLRAAGLAVAMGNAREAVKKICAAVVADCDHDGVGEAIERFLL